jgi:acetyltransferase-like isoleucine patch superfamily enzyme
MRLIGIIIDYLSKRYDTFRRDRFQRYIRSLFSSFGPGSSIEQPATITRGDLMQIGSNVCIRTNAWIYARPHPEVKGQNLVVGDNSYIGRFIHICAYHSVHIGKNALIADKVFITSADHRYEDIRRPIIEQELTLGPVFIGDNVWIGENAVIMHGVTIGNHCVVGANSVVKKNIPDYCVVVGQPARIIKRYDFDSGKWVRTGA